MTLVVREHVLGGSIDSFIRAGHEVFRGDPCWIAPLEFEMKERFNPKRNPFFQRAEVAMWTAWRGRRVVGRCTAQIDREHLRIHQDQTGFFGFFDTVDDEEVGAALIAKAAEWLSRRGMKRMRGPMSLYVNDELGLLVEGFDTPPVFGMAHSREYQGRIAESTGLTKEKDLLCWRYDVGDFPPRVLRAWEQMRGLPEVRLRSVELAHMARELDIVMDIYNDAWKGKWGVVPALPDEVRKVAGDLKLVLDPELAFIVEIDGRPMGMCIMLPNLNEAIADLGGKLLPIGWLKLLWRLKVRHPISTRLMMLGVRSELRGVKRYGGLSAAMYVEVAKRAIMKGYRWGELSWTREDDNAINLGIRSMGAKMYKRYRIYEKELV